MSKRTNLGRSLARRSSAARRRGGDLGSLLHALDISADEVWPLWDLKLEDGAVVQARGTDGIDAARRWYRANPDRRPTGVRRHT